MDTPDPFDPGPLPEDPDMSASDLQDLRTKVALPTHTALFARAAAEGVDMAAIARRVLDEWAAREVHAATVLARLMRGEGARGDHQGGPGE